MIDKDKQIKRIMRYRAAKTPEEKGFLQYLEQAGLNDTMSALAEAMGKMKLEAKGEKGDKGDKGDQGIQGIPGRDGTNGKNGVDGKDGKNGLTQMVDYNKIYDYVDRMIPEPIPGKDGRDGSPDMAEDIRNKLELLQGDERLHVSFISGIEEMLKAASKAPVVITQPNILDFYANGARVGSGAAVDIVGSGVSASFASGRVVYTVTGGGGGGTPANPVNGIQYNKGGAFWADSNFERDPATQELTMLTDFGGGISGGIFTSQSFAPAGNVPVVVMYHGTIGGGASNNGIFAIIDNTSGGSPNTLIAQINTVSNASAGMVAQGNGTSVDIAMQADDGTGNRVAQINVISNSGLWGVQSQINTGGNFLVQDENNNSYFNIVVNPNPFILLGDINNTGNRLALQMNDTASVFNVYGNKNGTTYGSMLSLDGQNYIYSYGDIDNILNGTKSTINDQSGLIQDEAGRWSLNDHASGNNYVDAQWNNGKPTIQFGDNSGAHNQTWALIDDASGGFLVNGLQRTTPSSISTPPRFSGTPILASSPTFAGGGTNDMTIDSISGFTGIVNTTFVITIDSINAQTVNFVYNAGPTFIIGETVTESFTGNTGTVLRNTGSQLEVGNCTGSFSSFGNLTGGTSGATTSSINPITSLHDTFSANDGSTTVTAIAIEGYPSATPVPQTILDGVSIVFGSFHTHTIGNSWTFQVNPALNDLTTGGTFTGVVNTAYTVTVDGINVPIANLTAPIGTINVGDTVLSSSGGVSTVVAYFPAGGNEIVFGTITGTINAGDTVSFSSGGSASIAGSGVYYFDTFSFTDGTTTVQHIPANATNVAPLEGVVFFVASDTGHGVGDNWTFTGSIPYTQYTRMLNLSGTGLTQSIGDVDILYGGDRMVVNNMIGGGGITNYIGTSNEYYLRDVVSNNSFLRAAFNTGNPLIRIGAVGYGNGTYLDIDDASGLAAMGDVSGVTTNANSIFVNSNTGYNTITGTTSIQSKNGSQVATFSVQNWGFSLGDISHQTTSGVFNFDGLSNVFSIYGFGNIGADRIAVFDNGNRVLGLGDVDNDFSNTFFYLSDTLQTIKINGIHIQFPMLQSFADNAAAITGGLNSGDAYLVSDIITSSYQIQVVI